jgi:hypothetical protein
MEQLENVRAEAVQMMGVFQVLPKLVVFDLDYTIWPFYWFVHHTTIVYLVFLFFFCISCYYNGTTPIELTIEYMFGTMVA